MTEDLRHDPTWLSQFKTGDQGALTLAVEAYQTMLQERLQRGFFTAAGGSRIRLRVHEQDERDDIVQDTFARAFRASARAAYSGESDYGAYLLRIARNLTIDRFRKSCTERDMIAPDAFEKLDRIATDDQLAWAGGHAAFGRGPEAEAQRSQITTHLREFLATLSDEDLQLITLYSEGEMSQRQAADTLGIERHQVRAMLVSVRERLLKFMKRRNLIDSLDAARLLELVTASVTFIALVLS
ncbi:MAG: RNA polymerase sigma factor (sigma-70 family) [Bradymonadia bacterium]|jgi:RNA polymerase sigma factor (sigma-70 family)